MSHVGSGSGQEVELNLAPIIDCFTVIIIFLLASASFLAVGALEAGVAAGSASPAADKAPPPVALDIELAKDGGIVLKLTGKATDTMRIPASAEGSDWDGMDAKIATVKTNWPALEAVVLKANDEVEYAQVVKAMSRIRKKIPAVVLGGY